jgi:hypothetical protein
MRVAKHHLQAIALSAVATCFAACVAAPEISEPNCDQPAPLDGEWNAKTPGYLVGFRNGTADAGSLAYQLGRRYGFVPESIYKTIGGFYVVELSPEALAGLRCEPQVQAISFNQRTWIPGYEKP